MARTPCDICGFSGEMFFGFGANEYLHKTTETDEVKYKSRVSLHSKKIN